MAALIINNRRGFKLSVLAMWLSVFLCMAAIFFASSLQGSRILRFFTLQEVFFHFLIYALLAFLFSQTLKATFPALSALGIFIFAFIFTAFYGISDEFHQLFVPGRVASVFDVFLDCSGGITGNLVFLFLTLRSSLF